MSIHNALAELIAEHRVPGAVLGVYANGEHREHAAGLLNTRTGVPVTTDSLFQIGSVSKVWTATLAMQLAHKGKLDLDRPVRAYLPDFRLADESAAAVITTRQLLCHTAGFDGDEYNLSEAAQLFEPGELFSYNNAGYCVLGQIIEALHGKPFVQCLTDHLIRPLNLTHTATDADQAILHRAAVGHLQPSPEDPPQPTTVWALPRSLAAAGSVLTMSARDLLSFARSHFTGEVSQAMRAEQVRIAPITAHGNAWALGWEVFHLGEHTMYGHNGNTIGQAAFLRLIPELDLAIALLTNGGEAEALHQKLLTHLLRDLAGIDLPAPPAPAPGPIDATRYLGTYGNSLAATTITQDHTGEVRADGVRLLPHGENALITAAPEQGLHRIHHFLGDNGHGQARFLHNGRAMPRRSA
ncbi:beta-lactamase family protein [Crossiella sp. SN42]|uniref:serine hydrolase domain-containing protein n=1 Tax=Crossiella sp. SN42 TaxID=2944808 RepID=UPI00207D206C|nr:serine hydrolase domain-containing protein [Crossiella sp. SN42]MCO1574328.1 beta-lactamase family protein [Crossiella sp. SN42]